MRRVASLGAEILSAELAACEAGHRFAGRGGTARILGRGDVALENLGIELVGSAYCRRAPPRLRTRAGPARRQTRPGVLASLSLSLDDGADERGFRACGGESQVPAVIGARLPRLGQPHVTATEKLPDRGVLGRARRRDQAQRARVGDVAGGQALLRGLKRRFGLGGVRGRNGRALRTRAEPGFAVPARTAHARLAVARRPRRPGADRPSPRAPPDGYRPPLPARPLRPPARSPVGAAAPVAPRRRSWRRRPRTPLPGQAASSSPSRIGRLRPARACLFRGRPRGPSCPTDSRARSEGDRPGRPLPSSVVQPCPSTARAGSSFRAAERRRYRGAGRPAAEAARTGACSRGRMAEDAWNGNRPTTA